MVVAEIVRARGLHGEVVVRSQTDVPGRLKRLKSVTARLPDQAELPLEIASAWPHNGNWVLKFAGIDSVDGAQRLRGAELWVPFIERGVLSEGEFFQSDLIGCQVIDSATGESVGVVEGWQEYGGPPLMEVGRRGRKDLIPFVASLCQIDLAAKTIGMEIPRGLLEL